MILLALLILTSVYDKSGFLLSIGERTVSVSPYKMLYLVLVFSYAMCLLYEGKISYPNYFDQKLYRLIWIVVLGQTGASLLGSLYTAGKIIPSSEIYYLIQRSNALMIPLWALRYKISAKLALKWFLGAIAIHYVFVILQIVFPGAYANFVSYVYNPLRPDNSLGWTGEYWGFIGLQRTQNYGGFVSAFILLVLGFTSWKKAGKICILTIVVLWLNYALFYGSRSVLILTATTIFVFFMKSRILSKTRTYLYGIVILVIAVCAYPLLGVQSISDFRAINRFTGADHETEGSNIGKLAVIDYALQLFMQSPIVGWGAQRFGDITAAFENYSFYTSEVHFYFLSVLISSGLVGLGLYFVFCFRVTGALLRRREWDYAIVCSMFIGLFIYNFIYDAGGLDVFGCFNGIAAYYALLSSKSKIRHNSAGSVEGAKAKS